MCMSMGKNEEPESERRCTDVAAYSEGEGLNYDSYTHIKCDHALPDNVNVLHTSGKLKILSHLTDP